MKPISHSLPPPLAQLSPICSAPISQTIRAKRKRPQDCEAKAERPAKYPRTSDFPCLELSGENLQQDSEVKAKADDSEPPPLSEDSEEDIKTLYKSVMSSVTNKASTLKRTTSWRSIVPSETDTIRSQRSSNTTAHYRYKHLEDANVYVHIDPPKDIQAAIENIINAKPSEDCRAILRDKAKNFSKKCEEMVQAAAGEDDFVHLFYIVIEDISPNNLISREKADWRVELKPAIQQSDANLNFLSDFDAIASDKQDKVNDS